MNSISYIPIIKTSDAEMRGLGNLSDENKNGITPIFELTKSRKSKKIPYGDIYKRLKKLGDVFGDRPFILDLTSDTNSTNYQIRELLSNQNGYCNWIDFLLSLKPDFPKLIPTIQINDIGVNSEKELYDRVKSQIESLNLNFTKVAYRLPLVYDLYGADLENILSKISEEKIICVVDAGFITQGKSTIYAKKAKDIIANILSYDIKQIALSSTSFPTNPTQFGNDTNGDYDMEECLFYNSAIENQTADYFIYGDYATINPVRNEQAGGNGWVPRIDMPTEDKFFYHRSRKRKDELTYSDAYIRVARLVVKDDRYKHIKRKISSCWGIECIESAADGTPEGLSPSFWISVRMNIHMTIRKELF